MKKLLLSCSFLGLLYVNANAQFLTATIDGVTDAGYATGADSWALGWDNDFLYIRKNTSSFIEPTIIYLDHNPIVPVSGGGNSDGNLIGVGHWGITPTLPFRADFTIYWEDSYLQYQTANGSGGWNAAVTIGTPERTTGIANKECRIPWSAIRGVASPPAAFNWFGYNNSRVSPGFIYHPTPVASNPTGVQASPRFFYYNSIVNTTNVGTTNPFALNQISFETRGNYDFTAGAYAPPSLWDMTINAQSGSEFLAIDKSIEIRNRLDIASPFSNLRPMGGGSNIVRLTLSGNQGSVRLSGGNTFGQSSGNIMELEVTGNVTLFSTGNFVDFRNFIVSSTGDLTANNVQMSSNIAGGTFTINGILRTSRTEGLHGANDFTIRSNNIPTITIGANSRIVYNNSGSQTVTTTANYANLEIAGSGVKTINGNTTVNSQLVLTAGTLSMGTFNLTVGNGVSGSGFLSGGAGLGNLSLTGGTSTLNFATGGTRNFLRDFTLSGAANVTLGNALNITGGATPGTVTVSGTAQLNTGGNLVLKSDALGTARVAAVTSSATTPISGEVTVERFIPQAPIAAGPPARNGRAWRLLSFPVTGSSTIWQAWGHGAEPRVSSLGAGDVPNPVQTPGIGTLITGHNYQNALDANTAGYDWWPALWVATNPPGSRGVQTSIRRFVANSNAGLGSWASNNPSRSTASTTLSAADPAYMLFVRGDRTVAIGSGATTLAPKGNLRVGNMATMVPAEDPTAQFFTYGNPYASTLDFGAVYFDGANSGLLKNIMHVWDANLSGTNGVGAYRSVSWNGSAWVDNISPSATNMEFIQSGQGVLLESDAVAGGTLTTRESHKVSGNRQISPFAAVNTGGNPMLYTRLYIDGHSGETNVVDGAVAGFNTAYSVGNEDAFDHSKPLSITGNLALGYTQGGKLLSFEGRPLIQDGDILYLQANGLTPRTYTLEFEARGLAAPGRKAWLKDKFLKTETEIPLTGEKFRYGFEGMAGDTASLATDRFEVVFKVSETKWIVLTGRPQRPNIILDWKVPDAGMFKTYIVEQSGNNISYRRVTTLQADQNAGTEISHVMNVGGGTKFFRVRGITHSGETITSNEVLIGMNDGTAQVTVAPNPATSGSSLSLLVENLQRANYTVMVLNANGAPLTNIVIRHDGRNQVYQFALPDNLTPGTYYIRITGRGGNIVRSLLVR
jgi:hypothetical protein